MTPQQALDILTQATGGLMLNRKDHEIVLSAIGILAAAITPPKPVETPAVVSEQHESAS